MILQLSAALLKYLKCYRIGITTSELSELVRQLRWINELPTILILGYQICWMRCNNPIPVIITVLLCYILIALNYILYEGMQELCNKI